MTAPEEVRRAAWLSADGTYRYALTRMWGPDVNPDGRDGARGVCWVMLNPSTADAEVDDPTIRRCLGFTRAWGFDRLVVVNLFALRSTNPKLLAQHQQPVGPENGAALALALGSSEVLVAAWGASYPKALRRHVDSVRRELRGRGAVCLGLTSTGEPRHPLYVAGATERMAL